MSGNIHVKNVRFLYKTILKLHRGMPAELQLIGDNYVKDEFRRHKKCKPEEAVTFMQEWSAYAVTLAKQLKPGKIGKSNEIGKPLPEELLDQFKDDQLVQLHELMEAATALPESVKK